MKKLTVEKMKYTLSTNEAKILIGTNENKDMKVLIEINGDGDKEDRVPYIHVVYGEKEYRFVPDSVGPDFDKEWADKWNKRSLKKFNRFITNLPKVLKLKNNKKVETGLIRNKLMNKSGNEIELEAHTAYLLSIKCARKEVEFKLYCDSFGYADIGIWFTIPYEKLLME